MKGKFRSFSSDAAKKPLAYSQCLLGSDSMLVLLTRKLPQQCNDEKNLNKKHLKRHIETSFRCKNYLSSSRHYRDNTVCKLKH